MDISILNVEKISSISACFLFVIFLVYQLSFSEILYIPGHFQQNLRLLQSPAADKVIYMPAAIRKPCFTPLQKMFGHQGPGYTLFQLFEKLQIKFDPKQLSGTLKSHTFIFNF